MNAEDDQLALLKVINRLEVGPVRVEKQRLIVPYTVETSAKSGSIDLIYRYEEPVFEGREHEHLNLAGMIGAQLALNYGLFCERIVFRGAFDSADRQFILDMMANTAREIYVKKLLEPNPFLVGEAARIPRTKRDNYVQAQVEFEDAPAQGQAAGSPGAEASYPQADPSRYGVLSSGGKDSLLSYALLKEIGLDTHPIFINESGRHWFTALNAYRYFQEKVPETARVWTNSDRLFSWMLRFLPFVRQDFANVRSDDYPIRLWTVAVFLFGALPLLRKRGMGRLVIGDEYDTTRRLSYQGITHYDGLYDQSRYFDNAMSRYFQRKGWGISQFSLLRPLSELSIQKILAERYPDLQQHQVSCHATHQEGGRVRPCGNCEKCRRIVSMLVAFGNDPGNCGYTPEQIERCLRAFVEKGVHQEKAVAEHAAFLLKAQGRYTESPGAAIVPREHPEVVKLRYDPERSPIEGLPRDLRRPLLSILSEHTEGAMRRTGRSWVDFDPLSDAALARPYPFDAVSSQGQKSDDRKRPANSPPERNHILGELTWPEAQKRFREVDVALLPVGATEQHGHHLPLDTDAFDAGYLARKVAEGCNDPKPLVLPLIPYGVSYHHDDFTGTISISPGTLSKLIYEIGMSVARHGITKLFIINGHGGNAPALHFAAQMINRDARIFTCVDSGETSDADVEALAETPSDVHAGEIETSTTLAVRPHLVRMDKARRAVPRFSSRYLDFSSKRSVDWYARTLKISKSGVMGDPTKASVEKGRKIWDIMVRNLIEFVEELKSMTLDEIHHKHHM